MYLSKIYTQKGGDITFLFFHNTTFLGSNSMCIWLGTSHLNTPFVLGKGSCSLFSTETFKTLAQSPPKFHIYDNLHGYQPEYYKCKLSKGVAKFAAELVPIVPNI